jgi:hypothetical protein
MEQKYKNRKYAITVELPADQTGACPVGQAGSGSVNIVNVPFIVKKITHGIIGDSNVDDPIVPSVYQDGQYTIQWRTDQHNYESEPLLANPGYGTDFDHFDLSCPEELAPKTTITVNLTNTIDRTDATTVQLIFHGLEPIKRPGEGVGGL